MKPFWIAIGSVLALVVLACLAGGAYVLLRYANYRTPIRGLYLCGAATHPGGGVTGACGYNAAREILRDVRAGRT